MSDDPLALLVDDHRQISTHLNAARGWAGPLRTGGAIPPHLRPQLESFGQALAADLRKHIQREDNALFPVLERKMGRIPPIMVMLMEHRNLEELETTYRTALASGDAAGIADTADAVVDLLSAHIAKEEQVLFPLANQVLSAADRQEVLALMQAVQQPG